jgi:membrane protease YdiL (CAAX protease family)
VEKLGDAWVNVFEAVGILVLVAITLTVAALALSISHPSPQLLRDLTQVGAALFVAYAIAIAAIRPEPGEDEKDHRNFLWGFIGIGMCGLSALGVGLALTAYREAGHAGTLDVVGLCWMVAAFLVLGLLVALYPIYVGTRST